jgi:Tol biopolymer transport system component
MRRTRLVTTGVCAILISMLSATHAVASFPGSNGWITTVDPRGSGQTIAVMRPDGSQLHRLKNTRGYYRNLKPAWSPAGNRLAVSRGSIHVLRPWTGDTRQVTSTGDEYNPAWSPNGKKVVYDHGYGDLYIANVHTRVSHQLTDTPGVLSDFYPSWSPNGSRIVFGHASNSGASLFTIRPDGSHLRELTPHDWRASEPGWSPDGKMIVFTRGNGPESEIYTMTAWGNDVHRLTSNGFADYTPVWSPDGTRIAFLRNVGAATRGDRQIGVWLMNPDGSDQTQILANQARVGRWLDWQSRP